jgi:hypothetical protein
MNLEMLRASIRVAMSRSVDFKFSPFAASGVDEAGKLLCRPRGSLVD